MTRLTAEQLEAIRKRAEKATPGRWNKEYGYGKRIRASNSIPVIDEQVGIRTEADAEFIANAREDIPKLLAEVERLQSQVDRMVSSAYEYLDTSTHTYMVAEEIEREDA